MSDVINFIYLNPNIHVDNNLNTLETASNYYYLNSNNTFVTGDIPLNFNKYIYLAGIANTSNVKEISTLNQDIYHSMLLDGMASNNIINNGEYVTVINKNIYLSSPNTFSTSTNFLLSEYGINSNNKISILKDNFEKINVKVHQVLNDTTFTVLTQSGSSLKNFNSEYKLMGIFLYDSLRLAHIKYLSYESVYKYDAEFNPDLYKLLYPTNRLYDDEYSYIDYLSGSNTTIGKTREIATSILSNNISQIENIQINNALHLNGGYLEFDNIRIHGISQDAFTDSSNVNVAYNKLVTEKSIKTYVDDKLHFLSRLNSNYKNQTLDYVLDIYGKNKFNDYIEIGNSTTIDSGGTMYSKNIIMSGNLIQEINAPLISISVKYFDKIIQISDQFQYTVSISNCIVLNYKGYKNIFQVISKSKTNGLMSIGVEELSNINLPIGEIITVYISVARNNITKTTKDFVTIENANNGLYIITSDSGDDISYEYVALTNNLVESDCDYCHLLKYSGDLNVYSSKSGIIDSETNVVLHQVEFKTIYLTVISYKAFNETSVRINLLDKYNPLDTFLNIQKFRFITCNNHVWKIKKVTNIDFINGNVEIDISTLDERIIAYDSVLFGYLMIDILFIGLDDSEVIFFNIDSIHNSITNTLVLNDGSNRFNLSYINNTLYLKDSIICSSSNIHLNNDLSILNNRLAIKQKNNNVIIENNSENGVLYIGSSNVYIDKSDNIITSGQIISPTIDALKSRLDILESIMSNYI
jgi:hypothetical protein